MSAPLNPSQTISPLADIRRRIARATREAGRAADSVSLVAISKTFDAPAIRPIIAEGQRIFGENRVQEAQGKWPSLRAEHPHLALHLVGPLQSNKTKDALALFDAIHSLDRESLCAALAKEIQRLGRAPLIFVQINTGAEPQKAGVLPEQADAFIARCRTEFNLPVDGAMCIPPLDEAPAPHFALTQKIAARNGLTLLSMGMSGDFEIAIQFGATHVRVGSAIFGHRA